MKMGLEADLPTAEVKQVQDRMGAMPSSLPADESPTSGATSGHTAPAAKAG